MNLHPVFFDIPDRFVAVFGPPQAFIAYVLFAVDGVVLLGKNGGKRLVDKLPHPFVIAHRFFKMDDEAFAKGILFAQGIGYRAVFHVIDPPA